jgi:hypothetical protein
MSYPGTTSAPWLKRSRALSRIASIAALSACFGCSSLPPKDQPQLPLPQPPAALLPAPKPLALESVTWRVLRLGDDKAVFALDARGYEALSKNMADVAAWMQEASWQLDFYRKNRSKDGEK